MSYNENSINMFCVQCKDWIEGDWSEHGCPSEYWVVADELMIGIVGRLYAMGIVPMTAVWTATEMSSRDDYEYLLTLKIDIGRRINEAVLGELPKGWRYYWNTVSPDHSELHMLAFTERWYNFSFETVDDRVEEIIKGFEVYLDTRDCEAVKALLLLTTG